MLDVTGILFNSDIEIIIVLIINNSFYCMPTFQNY